MKTAWDTYLDQQIADPTVRQAFEEETKVLNRRRRTPSGWRPTPMSVRMAAPARDHRNVGQ